MERERETERKREVNKTTHVDRICLVFVVRLDSAKWLPIESQYLKKWRTTA